jgi:hypothetical protein
MASSHRLVAELASIHHLRGNLCFPLGRLQECLGEHELALELAHGTEDSELAARALGGLGDAEYARGRMVSAHNRFSRCVELARAYATALENYTRPEPLPWAELFIGLGRALAARGRDRG